MCNLAMICSNVTSIEESFLSVESLNNLIFPSLIVLDKFRFKGLEFEPFLPISCVYSILRTLRHDCTLRLRTLRLYTFRLMIARRFLKDFRSSPSFSGLRSNLPWLKITESLRRTNPE